MHQLFATVVRPLLKALDAETVLEVGAGQGRLTRRLVDHSRATVHAVDPAPGFDPELIAGDSGRLVLHAMRSIDVLRGLRAVDLAILDGDPNWYTVITELRLLAGGGGDPGGPSPVIVLHNVDWPFGRRDGYYDPDVIPEAWRSPNAALGLLPGHHAPSEGGLALVPFVGLEDRLPNSGVRTAIDDFLAENPDRWRFVELPGLHGIGVLAPRERLSTQPQLAQVLDGFERVEFLASHLDTIERERVAALIRSDTAEDAISRASNGAVVPRLRTAPEAAPDHADEDRLDALQTRLELLERERDDRVLNLGARVHTLEGERATVFGGPSEARARLEVAERELERGAADLLAAGARVAELERVLAEATTELEREREAARAQTAPQAEALHAARGEIEQLQEGLAALLEERKLISEYVDRALHSRAWRIGHGLTSMARRVTFRPNLGTSALSRLQERLAPPLELGPASSPTKLIAAGEPEDPSAAG